MGKKLVLALALVALMAAPAFASVQNVKVGGSLKTTSVIRDNFDLGAGEARASQNVFLSGAKLNVDADLTDNVSTKIGIKNSRIWGKSTGATSTSTVEMETAYVTMKELLYSPLTVSLGRQPLAYGNEFLIGGAARSGTEITGLSDLTGESNFDAIKAVLSYDPLTVDLFAAKISEIDANVYPGSVYPDEDKGDANLFGVNANYKFGDKMNTVVEAYTFVAMQKAVSVGVKHDALYVPGLRVSTNPIEGLNVQLEGAYQLGDDRGTPNNKIRAFGAQGMVNYALPVMKDMKPVVSAGYTYLSGDKDDTDTKDREFNSLYEDQNSGRIFDALFDMSNLQIATAAFEIAPIQDLTAKLSWYGLYQVYKTNPFSINAASDYGADSSVNVKRSNRLGNEVDLDLAYAYTEDVTFGLSAGVFVAGTKIGNSLNNDDQIAKQVLTSVNVAF